MKFKTRNLRELANIIIGDNNRFPYRSSSYITRFFEECDLEFVHDGTTRWAWTSDRLVELLSDPQAAPNTLPQRFVHVFRVLMQKADAADNDPNRVLALEELNKPITREGFEAFYGDDNLLHFRHIGTKTISVSISPHRPFTPDELRRREELSSFLDTCSEDNLIEEILLPLFRQLGFHRISPSGHKDKALEYGKDLWMRYVLPTQHVLYFGLQAKKGKLDAAGSSQGSNANIAEIHNQALMMLGHELFDPETSKKVLVDHAFIVAGGEITKQARNWLGGKLDATKRSQILFMDREDILNLFVVTNVALPKSAKSQRPSFGVDVLGDEVPF
jgi:hypothetical protein